MVPHFGFTLSKITQSKITKKYCKFEQVNSDAVQLKYKVGDVCLHVIGEENQNIRIPLEFHRIKANRKATMAAAIPTSATLSPSVIV